MKTRFVSSILALFSIASLLDPESARAQSAVDAYAGAENGLTNTFAQQADGKLILGGDMSGYFLRRYPDGVKDFTYPTANASVQAIAVLPNQKVLLGGAFTFLSGQPAERIARLKPDGTMDEGFFGGANGTVYAIAIANGRIVIGGAFSQVNSSLIAPSNNLAVLNSLTGLRDDSVPAPSTSGQVFAIATLPNGDLLIGGDFNTVNGQPRSCLARLNWTGNRLTPVASYPQANGRVRSISVYPDGSAVVGGSFSHVSGLPRSQVALIRADGTVDPGFSAGVSFGHEPVRGVLAKRDGSVVVAGGFYSPRFFLARFLRDGTLDTSYPVDTHIDPFIQFGHRLFETDDGAVMFSGTGHIQLNGATIPYLARITANGDHDRTFNPGIVGQNRAIAVQPDGAVVLGGTFSEVAGQPRTRLARVKGDGVLDANFAPGANNTVWSILVEPDNSLLVAGEFTQVAGQPASRIARLNPDGTLASSFSGGAIGVGPYINVRTLLRLADGKLLVGGDFSHLGGQPRSRLGRFHGNGTIDGAFTIGTNSQVYTMAQDASGRVVVGGSFDNFAGRTVTYLARLQANGSDDTTFTPSLNSRVTAVAIQADGKIVVGGLFTVVQGAARIHLARLNANGTLDTTFAPEVTGPGVDYIDSIAIRADGDIVISGAFTSVNGQVRQNIARLNADGSLDTDYVANTDGRAAGLALQEDGKLLVGGDFANLAGQPRSGVGRLSDSTHTHDQISVTITNKIVWTRGGANPELTRVEFEKSFDGINFTFLGHGTRRPDGWELADPTITRPLSFFIRARGFYGTGIWNASGSIVETVEMVAARDVVIAFDPESVPSQMAGEPFTPITFSASGGLAPYTYSLTGNLPPNFSFNPSTGVLSATRPYAGSYTFTVHATDAEGYSAWNSYNLRLTSTTAPIADAAVMWLRGQNTADAFGGGPGGVLTGAVNFAQGIVGLPDGVVPRAFSFNGTNGYVALPPNIFPYPADGETGSEPFTFECWFQTTAGGVLLGQQVAQPYDTITAAYVPAIYTDTAGRLRAPAFYSPGAPVIGSSQSVLDGQWHHLAITYGDGGDFKRLYIDGVQNGFQLARQTGYAATYNYQLGTGMVTNWPQAGTGWRNFIGRIDEPAIYRRALTADEVAQLYFSGDRGKSPLPVITGLSLSGNALTLQLKGWPGTAYSTEHTSSLATPNWTPFGTALTPNSNGEASGSINYSPNLPEMDFFRAFEIAQ